MQACYFLYLNSLCTSTSVVIRTGYTRFILSYGSVIMDNSVDTASGWTSGERDCSLLHFAQTSSIWAGLNLSVLYIKEI